MDKYKNLISEVISVSQLTQVGQKKFKILLSAILINLTVGFDIIIIILFSSFFTDTINELFFLKVFFENLWCLPFIVLFRFALIYFEKMNIFKLQLEVSENLKTHLLKEIYEKGNYSIADATFFITKLTDHISYFYGALSNLLSGFVQLIIYSAFLIYEDFQTVLIFIGIGFLLVFPTKYLLSKGRFYMDQSYNFIQRSAKNTERVVDNLFLIKILKTEKYEFDKFKENNNNYTRSQLNNYKFGTFNSLFPNFIVMFIFAIGLLFFGIIKKLTLEFLGVTLRFFQTLGNVNNSLNMLINSHVHLTKLIEIEKNKIESNSFTYKILTSNCEYITAQNINFKYFGMDNLLFEDLNFQIKKGEKILLTGQNGSGKSTILGLIGNILIPSNGLIEVFSEKVGYVGVKPLIVEGSLHENLVYGSKETIDLDSLVQTIKKFQLFDNFKLPMLDRQITNKSLSSGQMQKISFIRALNSLPEILLLDEATSNIDEESKLVINKILNNLSITVINSTHNIDDYDHDKEFKIDVLNTKRRLIIL